MQRDAKKANKSVLKDFDKLKTAVADKAPTRVDQPSRPSRKPAASKSTTRGNGTPRERHTLEHLALHSSARSTGSRARSSSSSSS